MAVAALPSWARADRPHRILAGRPGAALRRCGPVSRSLLRVREFLLAQPPGSNAPDAVLPHARQSRLRHQLRLRVAGAARHSHRRRPQEDFGRYYSFDWGNAHFVCPHSNVPLSSAAEERGRTPGRLEQDLAAARKFRKVVFFHHPPYTTTRQANDLQSALAREHLVPILDRHGAHLVMNGHEHSYQRTLRLRGGAATEPAKGVVYATTAGGGADLCGTTEAPTLAVAAALTRPASRGRGDHRRGRCGSRRPDSISGPPPGFGRRRARRRRAIERVRGGVGRDRPAASQTAPRLSDVRKGDAAAQCWRARRPSRHRTQRLRGNRRRHRPGGARHTLRHRTVRGIHPPARPRRARR